MKSPARSRRHKTVEPIDFRELLDAPALNGLKEALAHRPESDGNIPRLPAASVFPGEAEPTGVESTAGEFYAVGLAAVETTPTSPLRPREINKSNASEVGTGQFTALDSNTGELHAPESGAHKPDAVDSSAPDLAALRSQTAQNEYDTRYSFESGASELKAVNSNGVTSAAVELTAVESAALDLEALGLALLDESALGRRTGRRTFNVQPATRIETIFSPSELKILNWMWSRGRAVDGISMARLVTASNGEGMRRLAVHFGVAYTTFRNLARSLSTKLAVEIVKQEATIYLVYHYSAILERVRQAGLTGVIHKGSNAWVLVDAGSQPAPTQPELTLHELKRKLIALKTHAVQTTALISSERRPAAADSNALNSLKTQVGAVDSGALSNDPSAVNLAAPIRNKEYPSGNEFPSSPTVKSNAPKPVIDALFERTRRTDADAARSITSNCTAANPTVMHDEIARLIREFQIPPSISNPVGLLIRTLATRCESESLERYRRHWEAEDLQAARFRAEQKKENERIARMVLEDPESDEQSREWARGVLGR